LVRDGVALAPSTKDDLKVSMPATGQPPTISAEPEAMESAGTSLTAVLPHAGAVRNLGPTSWQIADTAAGRLDAFWQFGTDDGNLLGGALVAREAGVPVTEVSGQPWKAGSGSFLAAAPQLHRRLVDIFAARNQGELLIFTRPAVTVRRRSTPAKQKEQIMAQKVLIEMVDDIDGEIATQTVPFSLDGVSYEIDLSGDNAAHLREELARFIAAGQRTGGRKVRLATGQSATSSGGDRERSRQVREWARANGYAVSERGRISSEISEAFEQARRDEAAPKAEPAKAKRPARKKASAGKA
jgi:nucleoid-associated protein Lsr2